MNKSLKRFCAIGILSMPMGVMPMANAQQPSVTDLSGGGGDRGSFYDQTATREEGGGNLVLFNRLQQNQEDLRRLRGQVEELRHQLERLRQQTRQQYMDIEDRLASASTSAPSADSSNMSDNRASVSTSSSSTSSSSAPSAETETSDGGDAAGRDAYQAAFAKVQSQDFAEARQAFEAFIDEYPQSRLAANAHYWLGELHSANSELDAASNAFSRVIESFPDSNKVPDALYKLGLLKARQGDIEASGKLLDQVQSEYPNSNAANLAQDFQRQSGN